MFAKRRHLVREEKALFPRGEGILFARRRRSPCEKSRSSYDDRAFSQQGERIFRPNKSAASATALRVQCRSDKASHERRTGRLTWGKAIAKTPRRQESGRAHFVDPLQAEDLMHLERRAILVHRAKSRNREERRKGGKRALDFSPCLLPSLCSLSARDRLFCFVI